MSADCPSFPVSTSGLLAAWPRLLRLPTQHPAGFYLVCIAVFCERWAAYILGSSLVLMLCERYGYSRADALRLAGIVNAATYLGTLPVGIASDRAGHPARWLGASMGLLAVGYAALVITAPAALWLALGLLLVGHALFKPNTQAAIASQYPVGDSRLDAAQILFYIAVNAGATLGSTVAGLLIHRTGWSVAFETAAVVMLVGLLALILGHKVLRLRPAMMQTLGPDVAKLGTSPPALRAKLIGALILAMVLYTIGCGQVEGSLLLWAQDRTDRALLGTKIPATWFVGLPAVLVMLLAPVQLGFLRQLQRRVPTPRLVAWGLCAVAFAFVALLPAALGNTEQRASMGWLVACLTLLAIGELLVAPLGLSLLLRLAPPRFIGALVGAWYVSRALGFWLAAEIGVLWIGGSPVAMLALLMGLSLAGAVVLWWASRDAFKRTHQNC